MFDAFIERLDGKCSMGKTLGGGMLRLLTQVGKIIGLAIVLTGCNLGPTDPFPNLTRQEGLTPGIHLDPELSDAESQRLNQDRDLIRSLEIDGSKVKYFSNIFGGTDAASVVRYLEERVHWVVSSKKDLDQTIVSISERSESASDSKPQVVASNVGAAIWFAALLTGESAAGIKIGSSLVEIRSTRAGVIQLGEAYSSDLASPLLRVSTLVHEARHSDCTGGVSKPDLQLLKSGREPSRKECGHLHSDCPAGHAYAGYPACDDHPWGAYAVEADYMAAVARSCPNCSAEDQKMALVVFADAASRVLDLDGLLEGKYGSPDMTSSDAVLP
jgi:hypothetical protein